MILVSGADPTSSFSFWRTSFFIGRTYALCSLLGKMLVFQVEEPMVTVTGTEPKPLRFVSVWKLFISVEISLGTVMKCQEAFAADHSHNFSLKMNVGFMSVLYR